MKLIDRITRLDQLIINLKNGQRNESFKEVRLIYVQGECKFLKLWLILKNSSRDIIFITSSISVAISKFCCIGGGRVRLARVICLSDFELSLQQKMSFDCLAIEYFSGLYSATACSSISIESVLELLYDKEVSSRVKNKLVLEEVRNLCVILSIDRNLDDVDSVLFSPRSDLSLETQFLELYGFGTCGHSCEPSLVNKIGHILIFFGFLSFVFCKKLFGNTTTCSKVFTYAHLLFPTDFGVCFRPGRLTSSWMVDNKFVEDEDCLFVSDRQLGSKYISALSTNDLNSISLLEFYGRSRLDCVGFVSENFRALLGYMWNFPSTGNTSVKKVLWNGLYTFVVWKFFLDRVRFQKFVCYQGLDFRAVFRNSLLKESERLSIRYDHSFNFSHQIYDRRLVAGFDVKTAFAEYDLEVHWSELAIDASKNCFSTSRMHEVVKPGWSFLSRACGEKVRERDLISIGVFFSSFGKSAYSSKEIHIGFLEIIIKFAEFIEKKDMNVKFVLKGKYSLRSCIDNLPEVERLAFETYVDRDIFQIHEPAISSAQLIGSSDFCISMAFTSPTIEAWSVGIPGVFVDVGRRFENNLFCDGRNLVSYDAKSLVHCFQYWLALKPIDIEVELKSLLSKYVGSELSDDCLFDRIAVL